MSKLHGIPGSGDTTRLVSRKESHYATESKSFYSDRGVLQTDRQTGGRTDKIAGVVLKRRQHRYGVKRPQYATVNCAFGRPGFDFRQGLGFFSPLHRIQTGSKAAGA
jgi:hypothetical protein